MKLIQAYLVKISIGIFILAILMDLYLLFLIRYKAPRIFDSSYEDILTKSENKSIIITKKIEQYISNIITKYSTDLKLICKHSTLLIGKQVYNSSTTMNRESTIFKNNNELKNIIIAELEELNKYDYIKKTFNETFGYYDYISSYEKKFSKQDIDNNFILEELFSSEHKELDTISYFNMLNKNKNFLQEEEMKIKFLISILKTIFIRRYIVKRNDIEYSRIYILNKEEIFIYPPEAYANTLIYSFQEVYGPLVCDYNSANDTLRFPLCIYNYMINKSLDKEGIYASLVFEQLIYDRIYTLLCLKLPFEKNTPPEAVLCIELEFSKIFSGAAFSTPKNFEFGVFAYDLGQIIPLFNSRNEVVNNFRNLFSDFEIQEFNPSKGEPYFKFFHFLYYNLIATAKNRSEINLNLTNIIEEYNSINQKIINEIENNNHFQSDRIIVSFNKTVCKKGFTINNYECYEDEFKIIILPLLFQIQKLSDDYLETKDNITKHIGIYTYSIISTNPKTNKNKLHTIINIKAERTFILFLLFTLVIFCAYILLINLISELSLNPINKIINELQQIETQRQANEYYTLNQDKIVSPNNELFKIKNIYEVMRKILIIKQAFKDENYLTKHNTEFCNLLQNINIKDIKEICNSFIGVYHFQNRAYNLAENEFKSTILFIQENENKVIKDKNNEYDDKIKDAIKRSSTVSYINEYSVFEKVDENMLAIIKLKIYKQRFIYLYAMSKFRLGKGDYNNINPNEVNININKNKQKKDKEKRNNYYKEAIKYFNECKNINTLLGINQIKIIYCLIMISKCYMRLNDYRNSINNINEALSLFFEFSKSFKDYHSKNYNAKVMLFIENNIFHYILYNIERICYLFNRPDACCWIIMKLFETSPFLLSNIHYQSANIIQYYLEKSKGKITKAELKNISNTVLLKQYEKAKKYYSKIVPRINIKNINNKIKERQDEKNLRDNTTSFRNMSDSITDRSNFSSTLKKEMATGRISSNINTRNKNANKIVTLCLMEKILKKVNGLELKDVIIKYFMKYFMMNENDKFSFIQFTKNGKKSVHINAEPLDYFIQKIIKTNNAFEIFDSYNTNQNSKFTELYNIFNSIIKNYPSKEDIVTDNIIIMFINSDDIRFTSVKECINIVEELNKKNTSVYLLSYDKTISREKINNIHSFLNGLFEGYFFQIKNYQQIKQIFVNLSTLNYQSNFFGYDFDIIDHNL